MSSTIRPASSTAVATRRGAFRPAITLLLAALGVPRVLLHDLDVVDEGDAVNLVLVFGPEELVLRSLSVASSLAVGLVAGGVSGFVARALLRSRGPTSSTRTGRRS